VACAIDPSVISSRPQLIFPSKASILGIYLNFQQQKSSVKNQYLPHSEIQILPNKFHEILLIKIFSRNTKGTFQFVQKNFDYDLFSFHFIFSEEIIQYSRTFALPVQKSWNQAHAPLLIESFPMTPRTRTWSIPIRKNPHNYKTNYFPSYLEVWAEPHPQEKKMSLLVRTLW